MRRVCVLMCMHACMCMHTSVCLCVCVLKIIVILDPFLEVALTSKVFFDQWKPTFCIVQLDKAQVAVRKHMLLQFVNLIIYSDRPWYFTLMSIFEYKISVYPLPAPFIMAAAVIKPLTTSENIC